MKWKVFILMFLIFSCSDIYEIPETHYVIEAGTHQSKIVNGFSFDKLRTLKSERMIFTVRFDSTARYDLQHNDQYDINKLMGFSEANQHHQQFSARLGWRYSLDKDLIEIFSYLYSEGNLSYEHITDVKIDETIQCQINLYSDTYEFIANGYSHVVGRNVGNEVGVYYRLFPYFGGDQVAPHDINIYIKEEY